MKQPLALTWEEQISLFEKRGLVVKPDDVEKIKHISYYRLKEFAKPLEIKQQDNEEQDILYDNIEFAEVLARYYQDKNLRIYLLHAIEKIEVSVKTKVSFVLGDRYGAFGYLNFSSWTNRDKFTKYTIERKQFFIKKNLLKIVKKSQLFELKNPANIDSDGFPTVWLAIDLLMFGDVVSILKIMSEKNLKQVCQYYSCTPEELISWLKCLNFIRNICAHNSNVLDIQITTKPKLRPEWRSYIDTVTIKQDIVKPSNKLSIVIAIVVYLVNTINSKYKWKKIQSSLKALCKKDDSRAKLLGFKDYNSVKAMIDEIKYSATTD
ncbi:Abi family protein [Streptococcus phocae]|uniref:CAAX protease n=1 Tax=Streptococcus phocae TaxID=119224 RepID=A0A0P6SLJ9_9STRE|nr:Abi family protein [Streptococcus phocae]KPJ22377.1 CAAX protease [Streptococcus phocae]